MSILNVLDLGWCQGYMGLKYHYDEAYEELGQIPINSRWDPPYAIFSRKYYQDLKNLRSADRTIDYCFIGSLRAPRSGNPLPTRDWLIEFIKPRGLPL